ncbi:MAG: sulfatase [bacterium]
MRRNDLMRACTTLGSAMRACAALRLAMRARGALVCAMCVCVFASACGCARRESAAPAGADARLNILLITIDTLRQDHLACYGHPRVKTPAIDRLAREGELVATAVTAQPKTGPAHASIFTGLSPGTHGIRRNGDILGEEHETLAELARDAGYETAGFIGGYPLTRGFGYAQGFDTYQDRLSHGATSAGEGAGKRENFAREVADSAIAWLGARTGAGSGTHTRANARGDRSGAPPFFAFVHFFDPHAPYEPPPPLDRAYYRGDPRDPRHTSLAGADIPNYVRPYLEGITDIEYPIALYDGEITSVDFAIERILAAIEDAGLLEKTLVVLTADHGESLSEHGYYFCHKDIVYEDNVRVPLIVRRPAAAETTVADVRALNTRIASTTELFAFLCDAATSGAAGALPGSSGGNGGRGAGGVAGAPRGDAGGGVRVVFSEQHIYKSGPRGADTYVASRYAAQDGAHKFVSNTDGDAELYRLDEDPRELVNIIARDPAAAELLRASLAEWLRAEAAPANGAALDAEVVETLKSLGYVDH